MREPRGLGALSIALGLAAIVSWAIMVIAVMSMGGARLATQAFWAGVVAASVSVVIGLVAFRRGSGRSNA